jgi:hypothetical protein
LKGVEVMLGNRRSDRVQPLDMRLPRSHRIRRVQPHRFLNRSPQSFYVGLTVDLVGPRGVRQGDDRPVDLLAANQLAVKLLQRNRPQLADSGLVQVAEQGRRGITPSIEIISPRCGPRGL